MLSSLANEAVSTARTSAVTEQYPQAREPLSDGVCEQRCGGGSAVSSGNEGGGVPISRRDGRPEDSIVVGSDYPFSIKQDSGPPICDRAARHDRGGIRGEYCAAPPSYFAIEKLTVQ